MQQLSPEQLMQQAVAAHQAGKLDDAETLYRQIIAARPNASDVVQLLGVIQAQRGRPNEAVQLINHAIAIAPRAMYYSNLGNVLRSAGQDAAARAAYEKALALEPGREDAARGLSQLPAEAPLSDDPKVLNQRGVALATGGNPAAALPLFRKAISIDPTSAEYHSNLGNTFRCLGQSADSIAEYEHAIRCDSNYGLAYNNLGVALAEAGQFERAIANHRRAVELLPDDVSALNNLGSALHEAKHLDEAMKAFQAALRLRPQYPEVLSNMGNTLLEQNKVDEAIALQQQAAALLPSSHEIHNNFANALMKADRVKEAIVEYRRSIMIHPDFADSQKNFGIALADDLQMDEAKAVYRRALQLAPGWADGHWNLSLLHLVTGDFEQGWRAYESRWGCKKFFAKKREFPRDRWDGAAPIKDKTILIHWEQGFGDTLQFVRYVPLVAQLGARVVFLCQTSLMRLLSNVQGVWQCVDEGEVGFDEHIPLLSLPLVFNTTLATVPANVPYVKPDDKLVAEWAAKMPPTTGLKVGLVWAGSDAHSNDRNRSIAFSRLAPLLSKQNVTFFSLQKGARAAKPGEIPVGTKWVDLTEQFADFADTAALIANLDLVISVDTSVVHLAGAMGKPTWLMLTHCPDWRWLLDRTDSPWYPTMRIFRQRKPKDWDETIARVAEQLGVIAQR